ncbi:MAG: HAD family phosphatase [Pseudomonadota bacterium]
MDGVDLVIFDFDGVVVDSEAISLSTLRSALLECGVAMSADQVRDTFLGKSKTSIFAFLEAQHSRAQFNEFSEIWETMLFAQFRSNLQAIPEIRNFLNALEDREIQFCIASSGSSARIDVALEAVALKNRFQHIFSADHVARGKPAPDLFLRAAEHFGVQPKHCLVIEDSHFGVQAAKAARMRCLGFVGGSHLDGLRNSHRETLLRLGADQAITSFAGLI